MNDRKEDLLNALKSTINTAKADDYNDINMFEVGPSTMKNLDDLYGDDEENILLDDTNAGMMQALCNIAHKTNAMIACGKNPATRTFLTGQNLSSTIANMSLRVDEIHDAMVNMPLDDSDKTLISSETSTDTNTEAKPGLWDNIRKKKERQGKKYRPAKPGDKDRPDPEQWKKLTDK